MTINSGLLYKFTAVFVFLIGLSIILYVSIGRTSGLLIYALDDPYIHLAVAEELIQGNYGVNPNEPASPSSSILYPFLLAGLLKIGFGDFAPLVLNIIGACVTAWLVSGVFWNSVVVPNSKLQVFCALIILPILIISLNLIGLTMTGMEHSLHVMASVSVIIAMNQLDRGEFPSPLLLGCILLAPLIRFEGFALAIPALTALLFARRFYSFTILTTSLIIILAIYFLLMTRLGLPILPSSALQKSSISAAAVDRDLIDVFKIATTTALNSIRIRGGALIITALGLLILSISFANRLGRVPWFTVGVASSAIAAHLVAGRYGWFDRYEIYVVSIAIVGLLLAWSYALRSKESRGFFKFVGLTVCLTVIAVPYTATLVVAPAASENIYAQQYQMHRFAVEFFRRPVAVNDLGYVSYRNDYHVLDLGGLGSEAARLMNADRNRDAEDLAALTSTAGSVYAMVYTDWFSGDIPTAWCHIATLQTPKVTAAKAQVDFYLIDTRQQKEMEQALLSFAETLPSISSLSINNCPSMPAPNESQQTF